MACSTIIARIGVSNKAASANKRVGTPRKLPLKQRLRAFREGLNKPTNGLSSELRNGGISRLKTFESRRSGGGRGELVRFGRTSPASITPTAKTAQIGRNHGGAGIVRSSICCAMLPGRPSPNDRQMKRYRVLPAEPAQVCVQSRPSRSTC